MILCLVTDRRRFVKPIPDLLDQVRLAVHVGVDLIQVRERDLEAASLADLVSSILAVTRGSRTRVVVNDRLDVAIATRADGVHLRHDSIAVAAARTLAPSPLLVGRSVHDVVETRAVEGADYVIAGTVFPTPSKSGVSALLGLDGLRAIVTAATVPVLAIGGVTLDRLGEIAATGAAGVAAIGLFSDTRLMERTGEARRRFDSLRSAS